MKYLIIILCFLTGLLSVVAQQPNDDVDYKYDKVYLEGLIEEQLNAHRETLGLPPFRNDDILDAAAEDQTLYIMKTGRVVHSQPSPKKDTPFKRVAFYNGMHEKVGENSYKLTVGTFIKMPGETKKTKLKSYISVAKAIARGWIHSDEGGEIIGNKIYAKGGISVMLNEKDKSIIATHVIASESFVLPDGAKPIKGDYGIKPFDKSKCAILENKYSYLPYLMSDNIFFKDGMIYFYFHDLEMLKNILNEPGDGIAIDIILRDQFNCGEGNKFYPSKIHSGIMLPPISKSQIFGKNELKDANEIEVAFAPIPSYVDTNSAEFNLLIIKQNCLCRTIVYNNLGGENIKSLDLDLIFDTVSTKNKSDSVLNRITLTVPFGRNKTECSVEEVAPFFDSLNVNNFKIRKIDLIAFSSIDGGTQENKIVQERRAKSVMKQIHTLNLPDCKIEIAMKENWDGFYESIKGSPYEKELVKYSKARLKKIVNSDSLDYDLEPYLEEQREVKIIAVVEKINMDETLFSSLPKKYEKAIETRNFLQAEVFQSTLLRNRKNPQVQTENLMKVKIPRLKETVSMINNKLTLLWEAGKNRNEDSLRDYLLGEINVLLPVDPSNEFIKYNSLVLRLLNWSYNNKNENDPKSLLKEIRSLAGTSISEDQINHLMLNYNIISADYYYDTKKFNEREKALENVKKSFFSLSLDKDQTFRVANYFTFQLRIDWAIEIMRPFVSKDDLDEEFLFTFLSLAIYNKNKIPVDEYVQLLKRAKKLNEKRFCGLFGYPNMSFQLLKDIPVKDLYCKSCE